MSSILNNFSVQEIQTMTNESKTFSEMLKRLGYSTIHGNNIVTLKKYYDKHGIDFSHFAYDKRNPVQRDFNNIFIQNSTASQATLRRWVIKYQLLEYKCQICNLSPEWQGKPLTLILDHVNGINNDDRLENLRWICPNCNQQLETTGFRAQKYIIKDYKKIHVCAKCGQECPPREKHCAVCRQETKERISREELKSLIRRQSFVSIGQMYNVTDNAIRKWCKKYNLPSTKSEINKISDEDWNLI